MDPAVNGELVVPGGQDDVDLGRIEDQTDGRDEERGRDPLAIDKVDDAGKRDPCAELSLRERPDGGVAIAEAENRLVVDVEGEKDGDPRAAGPAFGLEAAASAYGVYGLQDLFVGPLPAGDRFSEPWLAGLMRGR